MKGNSPAGRAASPGESRRAARNLNSVISRIWRTAWTGIAFAYAGFVSLLLAVVIFPLIRLRPGTAEEKEIRSQRWIHWNVRVFFRTLEFLQVMRLRCIGGERLQEPGVLVVANHPTLIDAFCLISEMPQADCVTKASYYRNPLLAGAAKGAGYIPNLSGPQLVEECVERLLRGRSVIIFPEGTRSPPDGLGPFARGAAHVAIKAHCNPVPVTITCEPATLHHGAPWWDVPKRRFMLTLTVGEPLDAGNILQQPMALPRAARLLTGALRDYFERHLIVG